MAAAIKLAKKSLPILIILFKILTNFANNSPIIVHTILYSQIKMKMKFTILLICFFLNMTCGNIRQKRGNNGKDDEKEEKNVPKAGSHSSQHPSHSTHQHQQEKHHPETEEHLTGRDESIGANSASGRRNIIIITDMEPDDRIALAAVAARMPAAGRVLFVGTTVLNAGLKKALAKAQLRVTGMADVPVFAGTGGGKDSEFYKNTLKLDGCKAALSYTAEGQGILDENLLKTFLYKEEDSYYKGDELQNQIKIALENAQERSIDFLVLSPPTDLVAVLEKHPELMQKIHKVHIMGGWREGEETLRTTYNFNMDINASAKLIKWAIDGKLSCILYSTHVIAPLFGGGSIKSQNAPELIETILSSKAPAMEQFRKAASSWDAHLISVYEKLKGVIGSNAGKQFTPADPLVVIGYLEPKMIVKTEKIMATIRTKDQTKIGYRVDMSAHQEKSNLELVKSIDKDLFLRELQSAIQQLEPKESDRNNRSIPTKL